MRIQDYSDITYLLRGKYENSPSTYRSGKEGEPKFKESSAVIEAPKTEPERPREQVVSPNPAPPAQIEILPDLPTVDEELRREGVELVDSDTIFVGTRKIDLPIPLEKVESGLKKPLNTGWRWVAELTKYILARFHIVVKKVGKQFKLVEQN